MRKRGRDVPRRLIIATLLAATLAAASSAPAQAGQYPVYACHLGHSNVNQSWVVAAYSADFPAYACSKGVDWDRGIVTRTRPRTGTVPSGAASTFVFRAPAGTTLAHMRYEHDFCTLSSSFRSGLWIPVTGWLHAATGSCGTFLAQPYDLPLRGATEVRLSTTCIASSCNLNSPQPARASIRNVEVYVNDPTPPSVALAGGTITSDRWLRGVQTAQVGASDATGIRSVSVALDNHERGFFLVPCNYTLIVPCRYSTRVLSIDTRVAADGIHSLSSTAEDSAGNKRAVSRTVRIDNTPPGSPLDLRVVGQDAWRSSNEFDLVWTNPPESGKAPVAAASALICPASTLSTSTAGCVSSSTSKTGITRLTAVRVPKPGRWQIRLWLVDAAGNTERATARSAWLRYDNVPPALSIAEANPQDPQRVHVNARDGLSGIARGEIEIRRQGSGTWISLPVQRTATGLTAVVDDAGLPDGVYDLRAHVVDGAGNERSTTTRVSGAPAHLLMPLRVPTALDARGVRRVRGRKGRIREVLVRTATASFGSQVPVRGRLITEGGNPLGGADVEVFERTSLADQPWVRVGVVRTDPNGEFAYVARQGPSRTIQFRYSGTRLIRPGTGSVNVRVRAVTSLGVSRHKVVNGDEVVFRGRVRGAPLPSEGKLLQLQAYSRGNWRTFATPRANASTHRWHYAYRFTATSGTVHYRFRAVVPQESGFPFARGASRALKVLVRGL